MKSGSYATGCHQYEINVRRWNLFPEELILQSGFGRQYELRYYQSLSLALIR